MTVDKVDHPKHYNTGKIEVIHSYLCANVNGTLCGASDGRPNVMNEPATCKKCKSLRLIAEAEQELRDVDDYHGPRKDKCSYELVERLIAALKEATK